MRIQIDRFPQLKSLCWSRPGDDGLTGEEALAIYERNWRFVDVEGLTAEERALLDMLVTRFGNGVLNV